MLYKKFFVVIILFVTTSVAYGQKSDRYTNQNSDYEKGVKLFEDKQYNAAQRVFDNIINRSGDNSELRLNSEYYYALSAIRLQDKNADRLMENFVNENGTSPLKNKAIINIADYYYQKGSYDKSLHWYEKLESSDLPSSKKDEFIFKRSFVQYKSKDFQKAQIGFRRLFDTPKYSIDSKYYYAHSAYLLENNKVALEYFTQIQYEEKYRDQIPFFIAQIYFNMEEYAKVIEIGLPYLSESESEYTSDLSKIVGESYFYLEDYKKAIDNLVNYKGKFDSTDYYQLGYAYYRVEDFNNAINNFNKLIKLNNKLAQNAYYILGASYLKMGKKAEALNAFKSSADMSFDETIQEDAMYNYAKLSFEVANINEMPAVALQRYLTKYPNSIHKNEVYNLLVNSFLLSNNYAEVMSILDSTDLSDFKLNVVYQKAAFYQGVEYFVDEDYWKAKKYFEISLDKGLDLSYRSKAKYWLGDTYFNLENYNEALAYFVRFKLDKYDESSHESFLLPYSLGYSNFKLKNYSDAVGNFEEFLGKEILNNKLKNDATLRLADSYFAIAKYWEALETYNKSIKLKAGEEDYAYYQKAVCYGLVGKSKQRVETLNMMLKNYPNSKMGDDALYLLATSFTSMNDNISAISTYDKLIAKHPNSSFIPKALLNKALIYYNSNKNEDALKLYRQVVDTYPGTKESREAVAGAKKVYIDMGEANQFLSWAKNLDFIDLSESEVDSTQYIAAEKSFFNQNYAKAISGFKDYIENHPKGSSKLNAHYYLAQSYFKVEDLNNAVANYSEVLKFDKNEFTENSLISAAEIYRELNDTTNALPILERIVLESENEQNRRVAEVELMHLYDALGMEEKALESAMLISVNSKVSERNKSEAYLIIARNAFFKNELEMAKDYYAKLEEIAKGEMKAEALYYKAFFYNNQGQYQESNTVVFEIASKYSAYKYWGAKALLVMAANFDMLNDQYQAVYTLETIISKFDFPDIKKKAEEALKQIESRNQEVDSLKFENQ